MKRVLTITAIAGSIAAIAAAAAVLGIDLPKLATQQHVANNIAKESVRIDKLTGEVKSTRIIALENAISADERRAGDLELQAHQLKALGKSARAIIDQVRRLRKAVAGRELELEELRRE